MKLYYYYLRRKIFNDKGIELPGKHPYSCICIGYDQENRIWNRGISLCSTQDNFVKEEARKQSRGRCLRAMFTKSNTEPINYLEANIRINKPQIIWLECAVKAPWKFTYKSEHLINLTDDEYNIIKDEKLNNELVF